MDQQTLLYVMTAFVIVAAVALVLQFAMLFGIYRTAKATEAKMTEILPKAHSFLDTSQKVLEQGRQQITEVTTRTNDLLQVSKQQIQEIKLQVVEITAKTNEILDSTKRQVFKIEDVLNDATGRAKVQIERAELVLDDTVSRAHETVAMVHSGILRPLREIQGIAAGVKGAIGHLARGTRPSVAQATHDEEMFI